MFPTLARTSCRCSTAICRLDHLTIRAMACKRKQSEAPAAADATPSMMSDLAALTVGMEHLKLADDRLAPLIESFGAPERLLAKDTSCFRSLAKSIIYQQLAGSAAAAIYARFLAACGVPDESHLTPGAVLAAPLSVLRGCGLSERKASYLTDLAAHFADGRLSDQLLTSLPYAELLEKLTAVRGIGPWTVDMFAMFHIGHPDILPVGDLGVRKGLAHLCGLKHLPSPAEMHELTQAWQPYRSLGCYYMWRIPLPPSSSSRATSKAKGDNSKAKGKVKGKKPAAATSGGSSSPQQQQQPEAYRAPAPAFPLGGAVPAVADVGVNPLVPMLATASAKTAAAGRSSRIARTVQVNVAAEQQQDDVLQQDISQSLHITPMKPLAAGAGESEQEVTVATAAAGGSRGVGMVTRRRRLWAQKAAADSGDVQQVGFKARIVDL